MGRIFHKCPDCGNLSLGYIENSNLYFCNICGGQYSLKFEKACTMCQSKAVKIKCNKCNVEVFRCTKCGWEELTYPESVKQRLGEESELGNGY